MYMEGIIIINILLVITIIGCICIIAAVARRSQQQVQVPIHVPVMVPPPPAPRIQPEYRPPPTKTWKAADYQQMGLLTSVDGTIRPLYGRESKTHRDRYFYYTTTPGDQIYPIPITHRDRDCTEDIGCPEFYGNENVSVFGMSDEYKVKLYPNKQFLS